jgi:hypothetical protein
MQFPKFQPRHLEDIARDVISALRFLAMNMVYPSVIKVDLKENYDFRYPRRHLNTVFEYLKNNGVIENFQVSVINKNEQSDELEFFLDTLTVNNIDYDKLTKVYDFLHEDYLKTMGKLFESFEEPKTKPQASSQGSFFDLLYKDIKISSETLKCEINGYSVDLKTGEEINAGVLLMELIRLQQNGEAVKDREGFGNRVFQKAKQFKTRREVKNFSKFLSNATTKLRSILRDANSCCEIPQNQLRLSVKDSVNSSV